MNHHPSVVIAAPNLADIVPQVATYADLPSALDHSNQFYYVQTTTGVWLINRKLLGIYKSNGVIWEYAGDLGTDIANRNINTILPLSGGGPLSSDLTISLPTSSASQNGYLTSSDWTNFNNKQEIYFSMAVAGNVVENDVVKNAINQLSGQAPLNFVLASADADYWAIIGVAKNVANGIADIHIAGRVTGFNFGAFVGVEYYVDPANPGKITWTTPSVADPIRVGRSLDSSSLILMPHQQRQFVQTKGAIYTSDGHWDDIQFVGANGNVLIANSAQALGLQWAPAVVAAAPFTYTLATRTLTIAVATNAIAGVLSAADHTTYSGYAATIALKAPLASPVFTGDVNASTGNILASTLGKGLQIKSGTNAKIGTAVLVGGTVTVANTSVTANSRIFLTSQSDGGSPGFLRITAKSVGTSFIITSSNGADTSTVAWVIIESI